MRKIKISSFLICCLIPVLFLNGCTIPRNVNHEQKKKNLALIVKMKGGDYWKTVKMGADLAAKEYDVNLHFMAPDDEEDIQRQIELVNEVIDLKIDGLILAPSDFEKLVPVTEKAYAHNIPVIIIDAEINTDQIHSFIGTDNFDAGKKAGETFVKEVEKNGQVAIISFVKGTGNAENREKGLIHVLEQYPEIEIVAQEYGLSDSTRAERLTKEILHNHGEVDGFVALNTYSSIGVAKAIHDLGLKDQVKVVTFDSTPEEIDYLEKGVIQATIIQNPFSMGYLGVKHALDVIEGKEIPKVVDTGSKVINKQNMYLPENEKVLFPFVK